MRGVILREYEIKENALNKGQFTKRVSDTLRILAKYYCGLYNGESKHMKDEVVKNIDDFMTKNYPDYKPSKWNDKIEQIVKSVKSGGNFDLIDVNEVIIYKSEWDVILSLETDQLQRLAFILLVYQKINELKNPKSDGWINIGLSYIFMESNIRLKEGAVEQKRLLNKLYKMQYIKQKNTVNCTSLYINYRELDKNEEIAFKVTNLDYSLTFYYEYKDNIKYIECFNCKKRVKVKANNQKYCNSCSKKIDNKKRVIRRKMSDSEQQEEM